jgi:hypothetical protein
MLCQIRKGLTLESNPYDTEDFSTAERIPSKWTLTVHQGKQYQCFKKSSYSRRRPPPPGRGAASADLTNFTVKEEIGRMKFIQK